MAKITLRITEEYKEKYYLFSLTDDKNKPIMVAQLFNNALYIYKYTTDTYIPDATVKDFRHINTVKRGISNYGI